MGNNNGYGLSLVAYDGNTGVDVFDSSAIMKYKSTLSLYYDKLSDGLIQNESDFLTKAVYNFEDSESIAEGSLLDILEAKYGEPSETNGLKFLGQDTEFIWLLDGVNIHLKHLTGKNVFEIDYEVIGNAYALNKSGVGVSAPISRVAF